MVCFICRCPELSQAALFPQWAWEGMVLTTSRFAVALFPHLPPPPWWILGFRFRAAPPLAFKEPPAGVLWSRVLITPTSQLPPGAFRGPSLLASFLCCWPRWCSGDEHQTCLQTIPGLKIVPGAGSDMDGVHHPQHTALSQSPSALPESLQHCFS